MKTAYWTDFLVAVPAFLLVSAIPVSGDILRVPEDYTTIRAAAQAAIDGDEIIVGPGEYVEAAIDLTGKAVWLHSSDGPDVTTYDGNAYNCGIRLGGAGGRIEGLTIRDCDGLDIAVGDSVEVRNCRFIDNRTSAIQCSDATLTISGCTFRANWGAQTFPWYDGGGVTFEAADHELLIDHSEFLNNDGYRGAGIHVIDALKTRLDFVRFEGNSTSERGGAINFEGLELEIFDSEFIENGPPLHWTHRGGAIYVTRRQSDPTRLFVARSVFQNNNSAGAGAMFIAQWVNSPPIKAALVDCTFIGNTATVFGGAIMNFGDLTVHDCLFEDNRTLEDDSYIPPVDPGGGAISSGRVAIAGDQIGSLWIADSIFRNNTAAIDGGAVFFRGHDLSIRDSVFAGNTAGELGGAIRVRLADSATIGRTLFTGNQAVQGGAVSAEDALVSIANAVFSANVGSESGGAIGSRRCELALANCTVSANSAAAGGAMHVRSGVSPILRNSIIRGNSSDAIVVINSDPDIAYCNVEGGASGVGNIDAAVAFVDPDGDDDIPGTEDDDFRLAAGSPGIDAGSNAEMPADVFDDDRDCDRTEPALLDAAGMNRRQDDPTTPDTGEGDAPIVDMGAYEFGEAPPPGPADPCPADFNGDRVVDLTDLGIVIGGFEQFGGVPRCQGDATGDGLVDLDDMAAVLAVYGQRCN